LLRAALVAIPGVEAAFIFGSLARGDARPDSDVDLLVYGDTDASLDILYVFGLLARRVDDKWIDREQFVRWNDPRTSFLPAVLAGPKLWLIGSEDVLPRRERLAA
ncbi:MAG: nucleotidyltransferase domain-containing protein, partial [Gemmatimonadetes bacterium]|nr:nucleotidyltransferase domain-containing protein [Gemmatimonadota bacterium]